MLPIKDRQGNTVGVLKTLHVPALVEDASGCAHDTLMAPRDTPRYGLLSVPGDHDNCRDNLHPALAALGIAIRATPPSLNLFMNIPWTADGRLA